MTALLTHERTQASTTETVASADRGPLRGPWHRIRLTVQAMNYATRRLTELQAPWTVDQQWQSR
jgi:hypothetical protein